MQERFIGTWQLVSAISTTGTHTRRPWGDSPQGLLVYHPDGHMSAILAHPERRRFASGDLHGTEAEMVEAFTQSHAYAGTYTVNQASVFHHVHICTVPNWEGQTQTRWYRFSDNNRLTLSTPPVLIDGEERQLTLEWERATSRTAGDQDM